MAISFVNAGVVATGTTSLAVAYPASPVAGNLLVLLVANKYPTNGPATPGAFFAPSGNQYSRGGGTPGADTGDVYITVFLRIADGTEAGSETVTLAGANTSMGRMFQYSKSASATWDYACAGGSDNAAGTAWSVTAGSDPGVTASDMLLVGSAICGNTDTATAETVTQTGVTFGAMVEQQDSGSNGGDDIALWMTQHPVSSGAGSAAPVYTATVAGTGSATAAGASLFLRLREVTAISGSASLTLGALVAAATGAVAVAGSAALTLGALILAGTGSIPANGSLARTLNAVLVGAAGTVLMQGQSALTLGAVTLSATGTLGVPAILGSLSVTLGALVGVGTGTVLVQGTSSLTLGACLLQSAGTLLVQGQASLTLGAALVSATGAALAQGQASLTLAGLTLAASGVIGAVPVLGSLSVILGSLSLVSAGLVVGQVSASGSMLLSHRRAGSLAATDALAGLMLVTET